jgi:hypothetical protein
MGHVNTVSAAEQLSLPFPWLIEYCLDPGGGPFYRQGRAED